MNLDNSETGYKQLPLISISIPVFNEEENIEELYKRLDSLAKKLSTRCNMEFVFSDNHSDDATWECISRLADEDERVKAVRFSKNVGFQRSIMANFMHTTGDAVMQLDADMQDPPEMLEDFLDYWEKGFAVVFGVRRKRPESIFTRIFRKLGYWFIDKISEHPIPRNAGDFRLIDRKVVDALLTIKSSSPYIRGMIANMGFRQKGIVYDRSERLAGKSKFNFTKLVRLGLTAVFNHSTIPLRMASFLGGLMLVLSLLGALYYIFIRIYMPDLPRGFVSTQVLILFGIGLNSFLLGIIGEYILRIYIMLRGEPVALVEESLNIQPGQLKL